MSQQFQNQYHSVTFIAILFVILPAIVGMFFGAPLIAREVEAGTHRLVWTQGVSRRHWALVKFGLIGAITLILAAAYTLGMDWWAEPLVANGGRMGPIVFDIQGIAPIGYTLFAVALGIFASTVWKKVLPAMGVTLAGYAVVRILIETLARPHYRSPLTASIPITSTKQFNDASNDWVMSNGVINGVGKLVMPNSGIGCGGARWKRGSRRRRPVRLRPVQRRAAVPGPRPRTVLQLAAIPTRQQVLGIPGHRNRHLPRPDRDPALPRHPPHPPHLLTTPPRPRATAPRTRPER